MHIDISLYLDHTIYSQVLKATNDVTEKLKWWGYTRDYSLSCFDHTTGACVTEDNTTVKEWQDCGKELSKCSYAIMKDHQIDQNKV